MKHAIIAPIALLLIVLAGCSRTSSSIDLLNPEHKLGVSRTVSKSIFVDETRLEIATIKGTFPRDEIVPLRLSVTYTGDKPFQLTFSSAQKYDFAISNESGTEVWRWSQGRIFAQASETLALKTADSYNYFGRVDAGYLKPGRYRVSGWLLAEELVGEKVTINIIVK